MALTFVKSQQGNDLLVYKGFTFMVNRNISMRKYWKCSDFRIYKCSARCITIGNTIIKVTSHNHVPDPAKIETRKVLTNMKEKAITTQETTHHIVATASIKILDYF
jgi:hypothetical protein